MIRRNVKKSPGHYLTSKTPNNVLSKSPINPTSKSPSHSYNLNIVRPNSNISKSPTNPNMRKTGVIKLAGGRREEEEDEEKEEEEEVIEENSKENVEILENEDEEEEEIYIPRKQKPEVQNKKHNDIPKEAMQYQSKIEKVQPKSKIREEGIRRHSITEDAEEILDDNILKVSIKEKEVVDEKTGLKRVLVKKMIVFKDGTNQTLVYAKVK